MILTFHTSFLLLLQGARGKKIKSFKEFSKRKLFASRQTNFVHHLNCCRSLLLLLLLSFPPHYCVNRETIKLTRKFKSMTDILWLLLSSEREWKRITKLMKRKARKLDTIESGESSRFAETFNFILRAALEKS